MEITTIGLDLAKNVFQAHGATATGAVSFRKKLRREQVLAFFSAQPHCLVAMEACASSHFWAREIGKLGHEVRLIPPAYVKPFVKRQKNDAADAEAICEAAQRPTMRFVAVKSEEKQASAVIFRLATFWSLNERRSSTPCVVIWANMVSSRRRASPMSTGSSPKLRAILLPLLKRPERACSGLSIFCANFRPRSRRSTPRLPSVQSVTPSPNA